MAAGAGMVLVLLNTVRRVRIALMRSARGAMASVCLIAGVCASASAQSFTPTDCPALSATRQNQLTREHLFGGAPSAGDVHVRRGYVSVYDAKHRVPRWTAWHAIADYRRTPPRTGRWAAFRTDTNVDNPVVDHDYDGLEASDDLARGHMAPYFISGGDRDHDGRLAPRDIDDACTVFEINFMSDIAPQSQSHLNGSGGLWAALEGQIRQALERGQSFHIIAGTIFSKDPYWVGPAHDIGVPDMFFQIIISDHNEVVPFLFGHPHRLGKGGCEYSDELAGCVTTIKEIERWSRLDFFSALTASDARALETQDGAANWQAILGRHE